MIDTRYVKHILETKGEDAPYEFAPALTWANIAIDYQFDALRVIRDKDGYLCPTCYERLKKGVFNCKHCPECGQLLKRAEDRTWESREA